MGEQELHTEFEAAFRYLEQHTEVRDVLLSGGDALLLSDGKLEKILSRLRAIPHIEFLRIPAGIAHQDRMELSQTRNNEQCAHRFVGLWLHVLRSFGQSTALHLSDRSNPCRFPHTL